MHVHQLVEHFADSLGVLMLEAPLGALMLEAPSEAVHVEDSWSAPLDHPLHFFGLGFLGDQQEDHFYRGQSEVLVFLHLVLFCQCCTSTKYKGKHYFKNLK